MIASQIVYHRYATGLQVEESSAPYLLLVLLLLVALAFAATFTAMWRGRRGLGSGVVSLYAASALVAPVYGALVLVNPVHAADAAPTDVVISPWGVRCLTIAAMVGMLVLASFTVALRQSIPVMSGLRGAALGAAAGAWAGLSVFIFCPSSDLQHLFIGHVLPIVAFTLVGVVLIPRALRL